MTSLNLGSFGEKLLNEFLTSSLDFLRMSGKLTFYKNGWPLYSKQTLSDFLLNGLSSENPLESSHFVLSSALNFMFLRLSNPMID